MPGGAPAWISVSETTVKVTKVVPKLRVITSVRPVPVMATGVPPDTGPVAGLRSATVSGLGER